MASSPLRARGVLPACALLALVALMAFAPAAKADGEYDWYKPCEYKEVYDECDSPAAKEKCVKATCQKDAYDKLACKPTNETYCVTEDKCNPAKCVYGECKYEPIKCKDPKDPCKKAKCVEGYCVEENQEDGTECDLKSKKPNKCVVGKCEYGYCKEFEKECEFDDDYDAECLQKAGYCDPKKGCVDNKYKKDGTGCEKDGDMCTLERCYKGKCEVYDEKKCKFPKYDDDCVVSEGKCDPEYGCMDPVYKEDGYECDTDYNKCTVEKCEKGRCKKDGKKKCEYEYDYDDVCVKKPGYCDAKEGCKEPEYHEEGYECDTDGNMCTAEKCDSYGKCVKDEPYEKVCEYEEEYDKECVKVEGYCDPRKGCIKPTYKKDGEVCEKDYDKCTLERCYKGKCEVKEDVKCKWPKYDDECVEEPGECDPEYGCKDAKLKEDGSECNKDKNKCYEEKCLNGKCVKYGKKKCDDEGVYDKQCVKKAAYCDIKEGCIATEFWEEGYECDTDYNVCTVEKCDGYGECVKEKDLECEEYEYDAECLKKAPYCDRKKGCVKPVYNKKCTKKVGYKKVNGHCNDGKCEVEEQPYEEEAKSGKRLF